MNEMPGDDSCEDSVVGRESGEAEVVGLSKAKCSRKRPTIALPVSLFIEWCTGASIHKAQRKEAITVLTEFVKNDAFSLVEH